MPGWEITEVALDEGKRELLLFEELITTEDVRECLYCVNIFIVIHKREELPPVSPGVEVASIKFEETVDHFKFCIPFP